MPRYFFEIAYNGAPFHGWQRQPNAVSVQEAIEIQLSKLFSAPVSITGCGRTDTGVHASFYVFHADIQEAIEDLQQLCFKLNGMCGDAIAVHRIYAVKNNAHARFDAMVRSYTYFVHFQKDPFLTDRSYYLRTTMNLNRMNEAAESLIGEHDFTSFCKSGSDNENSLCRLMEARWKQNGHRLVFKVTANRFLRNMVRAMVGTLLEVGTGKRSIDDFKQVLEARSRMAAGYSVPPQGLFLSNVTYPDKIYPSDG